MRNMVLTSIAFVLFTAAVAQKKNGVTFNSYNGVGFIAGKLPVTFAAQTENGIKYKNWFIGAGIGIDNYYIQTLPLFGAVKKEFPFKAGSLFLYANAGKNLAAKEKAINNSFYTSYTKGGFYGDAGIGYKIKTTKNTNAFFCIGNSIKNIREIEETHQGVPGIYDAQRKFARISFKLGFQF